MAPPAKKLKRSENKENNSIKNYFKKVEQPSSPIVKETKQIQEKISPKTSKTKTDKQRKQKKVKESTEMVEKVSTVVKSVIEAQSNVTIQNKTSNSASASSKFKNLADFYPWIDEKISKTVFKAKPLIDVLMSEFCLFSTYKCMNEVCEFFTTDFEEFKKHLIEHSDSNCHYCSFCLKDFEKTTELGNHIEFNHRYDRFQCNYCMYRSCQKGYVAVHQEKFHSKAPCMILKSPIQKLLKTTLKNAEQDMIKNRDQFVSSYRCKTPRCKETFYCKNNFKKHLESEKTKPSCLEFRTIIDEQMKEIDHSKTSNKLEGFTECLFCHYGTDEDDILEHMSLNHQSEFAFVCKRSMPTFVVARETLMTHTTIEFIGAHAAELKNFKGDLEELKSK